MHYLFLWSLYMLMTYLIQLASSKWIAYFFIYLLIRYYFHFFVFVCAICDSVAIFSFLASLRKLDEQPEWLKGGKLRDYQLEGLNFLVNRCTCVSPLKFGSFDGWLGVLEEYLSFSVVSLDLYCCWQLVCDSWRNDTNVILADEMGLGKTVQSVSMLGFLQVIGKLLIWFGHICILIFFTISIV